MREIPMSKRGNLRAFAQWGALCVFLLSVISDVRAQGTLKFKFDPAWPKPLPNHWKLGGAAGLAIDKDDNVWVLNRPSELRDAVDRPLLAKHLDSGGPKC